MNKNKNFLGSFFVGTFLGLTLGVIFSPKKGLKIRKKLIKKAKQFKRNFEDIAKNLSGKAQNIKSEIEAKWIKTKKNVSDKIDLLENELKN